MSARHDLSRMRKIRARSTDRRDFSQRQQRKSEREGEIENRLLADNRSFNMLTVATKWLTEALASRFED